MTATVTKLPPWKRCTSCAREFTYGQWKSLLLIGVQDCGGGLHLEMRNCPDCGSTLAIELTVEKNWTELTGLLEEQLQMRQQREDLEMALEEIRRAHELADRARKAIQLAAGVDF